MTVSIQLSDGSVAVVDEADVTHVGQWTWHNVKGYARRPDGDGLHKVVWVRYSEIPAGYEIDHINGDKLDNQRSNLRLATSGQQKCNVRKLRRDNTSGVKGVRWEAKRGVWIASVMHMGDTYTAHFHDIEPAVAWRNKRGAELHGEFFVPSVIPPDFKQPERPSKPGDQLGLALDDSR